MLPPVSLSGQGGSAAPSSAGGRGGSQGGETSGVFIVGHGNSGSASASGFPSWLIYVGVGVVAVGAVFYFMRRKS